MASLEGGTTIAGYTALHSGLGNAYLGGNLTISGNVGIGTNAPAQKLHVSGTGDTRIRLEASSGTQSAVLELKSGATTNFIFTDAAGLLRLYTAASQNLTLQDNGGNVAIGRTTTSYKLDVAGDIIADGWLRSRNSNGWYSETYGGGWHMTDAKYLRTYNGKPIYIEKNNTLAVDLYQNGHIELRTNNGSAPAIGFHRPNSTALALYHQDNVDPLKIRTSGDEDLALALAGRRTASKLNDPTYLASGIYTNAGDGILNTDGSQFRSGWWHVIHSRHIDNNGYAAQIALPLSGSDGGAYYRYAWGYTWAPWTKLLGGAGGSMLTPQAALTSSWGSFGVDEAKTIFDYNGGGRLNWFSLGNTNGSALPTRIRIIMDSKTIIDHSTTNYDYFLARQGTAILSQAGTTWDGSATILPLMLEFQSQCQIIVEHPGYSGSLPGYALIRYQTTS